MRILILGSEGFIGSHCVRFFLSYNHNVAGADLFEQPLQQYAYTKVSRLSPELDEIFTAEIFDAVINASGSGNVPYSMTHPVLDFEANSLDTIRVLDAIRKHQPGCKYIHISSAAVYGNPVRLPIQEDDEKIPLSPYGWHKLISEQLCKEYTKIFTLNTAVVRPFSVYGPGLKKQMFWDIYQKTLGNKGSIELHGTGNESRDYIYINDMIHALDCILRNAPMQGEVYNLATGEETTIKKAVELFLHALDGTREYYFNNTVRPGDPLNWRADISKLKVLGFNSQVSVSKGLQELAEWLIKIRE
ncbi:MAG: NAD-dependent epimerase/dehydratase family protein [Cyclobacteriaceae bacterium]|nr:NAD-dependent epimerase/dehydratase family protein [Cyclobacteriaceae bacterium]